MSAAKKKPRARQFLAATDLLEHVSALATQTDGVRSADDIESVHRMRVASRRLRNAMRLFDDALPPAATKRWFREVKRITNALGDARDVDVQLVFLAGVEDALPAVDEGRLRPGLDRLRLRLTQRRADLQPKVVAAVDRLEHTGCVPAMHGAFEATIDDSRAAHVDLRSAALQREARMVVKDRLDAVLAFAGTVDDPARVEELHQMRIEAKHLRYTLEAYAPSFKGRLKEHIRLAKRVQTALGDIHDLDVWLDFLPQFIDEEQVRFVSFYGDAHDFRTLRPGLDFLVAHCRRERDEQHARFAAFWAETTRDEIWEHFDRLDRTMLDRPDDAPDDGPVGRVGPDETTSAPEQVG